MLGLAEVIVHEAETSGDPADRILREVLRGAGGGPEEAAQVSRAVFSWFRWRGQARGSVTAAGLRRALDLADRFAREPESFAPAALTAAALPPWVAEHAVISSEWVRTLQAEPVLWLRARPGGADQVARELPRARAGLLAGLPDAIRYEGETDLFRSPAFSQGRFEIQDVASQAVGVVCAPVPGETWWDACAGEGGKTLHLADLMQNRGVVWASDRQVRRLDVLRRRAARAEIFNYRVATWSAEAPPARKRFDGVLVDAPCSGLGTWQRNPHARWTTSPQDVRELAAIQLRLLSAAARVVGPGGRLIYAVCTMTHEETTTLAETFTAAHPQFEPWPFADPFAGAPTGAVAPQMLWRPETTRGNGMFVARWRRLHAAGPPGAR